MVIPDLDVMFDILDPTSRGYITAEEIKQFYASIHYQTISDDQVNAAIRQICSGSQYVAKEKFLDVLLDLDRRNNLEQQVRWDFMALDQMGSHQISLADALLLFKQTHGEMFSMYTWHQFLKSRDNSTRDVYFDEIKLWLCAVPSSEHLPLSSEDLLKEEMSVKSDIRDHNLRDLQNFKKVQEDEHFVTRQVKERNEFEDRMKREAMRKLSRWENDGVEGLLYDYDIDYPEYTPANQKDNISISRILDALDLKYDLLRKPLLWDMLQNAVGETLWSAMNNSEQLEKYHHLEVQEKQMRKHGTLNEEACDLYGAEVLLDYNVSGLMGETGNIYLNEIKTANNLFVQLTTEGKTDSDAQDALKQKFDEQMCQTDSGEQILIDLYQRQNKEREYLLIQMKPNKQRKLEAMMDYMIGEYCKLLRQHSAIRTENKFMFAAIAGVLSEHNTQNTSVKFSLDRYKHEILAKENLHERKGHKYKPDSDGVPPYFQRRTENFVDLQVDITYQAIKIHMLEKEVLVTFLQGRDSAASHEYAKHCKAEQRLSEMNILKNKRTAWRAGSSDKRKSDQKSNLNILQQAVAFFCVDKRHMLKKSATDDDVNALVLADLLEKQDDHFANLLKDIQDLSIKELNSLRKHQFKAYDGQYLDNIAAIVLQTHIFTEEEKMYLMALNNKYDALREKIITSALQVEHSNWNSLSISEQQRLVILKKMEERKLQQDGKYSDMRSVLGPAAKTLPVLKKLMGENRLEYIDRLQSCIDEEDQAAIKGQYIEVPSSELPWETGSTINVLADLQNRFDMEQNALISWLRSPSTRNLDSRQMEIMFLCLQLEWQVAETEADYQSAGIAVGLLERVKEVLSNRKQLRQNELAVIRNKNLSDRLHEGRVYEKQPEEGSYPLEGDVLGWSDAVLLEMSKKHTDERESLLQLLHDPSLQELVDAAESMPLEDQQKRLVVIQARHRQLNFENSADGEENTSLIEEAAAIQYVTKTQQMRNLNKSVPQHTAIVVSILTDLQDEQDCEVANILTDLSTLSEQKLVQCRREQINQRQWESYDNVLSALTLYVGLADDEVLMKELDNKYANLREVLMETLLASTSDWVNLTDIDKQKKIALLKHRERRLRKEGKLKEMKNLLDENMELEHPLLELMGYNKAVCQHKLREEIEKLKKDGIIPSKEDVHRLDETDESEVSSLMSLAVRLQQEKNLLFAHMRGFDGCIFGESERNRCWLQLRSEGSKVTLERNKLNNAAVAMGLAERTFTDDKFTLKHDGRRQRNLAKDHFEIAMQKKAIQSYDIKDKIISPDDKLELQAIVLNLFERNQLRELEYLCYFMTFEKDISLWASTSTDLQLEDKLTELKANRTKIIQGNSKQNHEILMEATLVCAEILLRSLKRKDESVTINDAFIGLVAEMQDKQREDVSDFIKDLVKKGQEKLVTLQKELHQVRKSATLDTIASLLFKTRDNNLTEKEVLEKAVEGKYDALKDKLLIEALMRQYGETEWRRMSELERQKKIVEIKLKERQLRKEGRLDELADLLEGAMKDQSVLNDLLSLSKEEQKKKLKERLEKRHQRLAQGMNKEECDLLEKEEVEVEEREKRRNVLLDLDKRCDEERDELLRNLMDQNGRLLSEKERQAAVARLRMEQRKLNQEERLDAAAILMKDMHDLNESLEQDRVRQEQLAKQRLAARLKQLQEKRDKVIEFVSVEEIDDSDIVGLQEAVMTELERKHVEERNILMQVLIDAGKERTQLVKGRDKQTCQDRLYELQQYHKLWINDNVADPRDQLKLFKEGGAMQIESKRVGSDLTDEDVVVKLLADLQLQQDKETLYITTDISSKTPSILKELTTAQSTARRRQWYTNVATVILTTEVEKQPMSEDDKVVKVLEEKYDAMRDKILMEALMRQAGEADWNKLTEKDRQARLIKLKLKEKKLRMEGRVEEAASLIANMLDNEREMNDLLGGSKTEQKRSLEERLQRLRQLKAEREAAGLATDEETLNEIVDTEEKEDETKKRRNVLENLQFHFEDEKAALLASLHAQTNKFDAERERQIALSKLRRDQKRIEQEDRQESAALLISGFHADEENREKKLIAEKERQLSLAKKRIEAHKKKLQQAKQQSTSEQQKEDDMLNLDEAEDKMKKLLLSTAISIGGNSALKEDVLDEVDKRHRRERNAFIKLFDEARKDFGSQEQASNLDIEEVKLNLKTLRQEHTKWKNRVSIPRASDTTQDALDEEIKLNNTEQFDILKTALVYRLEAEKKSCEDLFANEDNLEIFLLAELQGKQVVECMAMTRVLEDQEMEVLEKMKNLQMKMVNEGRLDNVAKAIFMLLDEEDNLSLADFESEEKEMNRNFEKEKDRAIKDSKENNLDTEEVLKKLAEQQEAKRQEFMDAMLEQKYAALAKLELKRQARDFQEYESEASLYLIKIAEKHDTLQQGTSTEQPTNPSNLLQRRLAARRSQRRNKNEEKKLKELEIDAAQNPLTPRTPSRDNSSPVGLMRREKTVIGVDVDEEKSKEVFTRLVQEQTQLQTKKFKEQARQEKMLQEEIARRRQKRDDFAVDVIMKGEQAKTILEKSQREERERQMAMIKNRVTRVRFERTMTMKAKSAQAAQQFDYIAQDNADGMTQDEKMSHAAKRMEEKFRQEAKEVQEGKQFMMPESDDEEESSVLKEKPAVYGDKNIKQRREERRKRQKDTNTKK